MTIVNGNGQSAVALPFVVQWRREVFRRAIPPTHKLVAYTLAEFMDRDGASAYPSIATIAAHCGIGERAVQRTIRGLSDDGLLDIDRATGRTNRFRAVVRDPQPSLFAVGGCHQRRGRGVPGTQGGVTSDGGGVSPATPEVENPANEQEKPLDRFALAKNRERAAGADGASAEGLDPDIARELAHLGELAGFSDRVDQLRDASFWRDIDVLTAGTRVFYLSELRKYAAWWTTQPASRQHRNVRRGFRSWIRLEIARDKRRKDRRR